MSRSNSISNLSAWKVNVRRKLSRIFYKCIGPIDCISRRLNNKEDFPPLYLRRENDLRNWESAATEIITFMILCANLKNNEKILELGCGSGSVPLFLKNYLDEEGHYTGLDIDKHSINHCMKAFSTDVRYTFQHLDFQSNFYNPKGKRRQEDLEIYNEFGAFDLILLKSVFTHMQPNNVKIYLREIRNSLMHAPNGLGRCVASFYILNPDQRELDKKGLNKMSFPFGDELFRYAAKSFPEMATAFEEQYLLEIADEAGLKLRVPPYYGKWTGRKGSFTFQDIIIFEVK